MKNILNYKYVLTLAGLLGLASCTDYDQDYPPVNKPVATLNVNSASVEEGESAMFTVTITDPISVPSDFKIDLLDTSNGDFDDFDTDAAHLDEYEVGPEGWQVTVPAYSTSATFSINTIKDLFNDEGTETLNFRLTKGQAGNSTVANGGINFTITIADFDFCLWTLEMYDSYGDGWQGGTITLYEDGAATEFHPDGFGSTYDVPVGVGTSYSFTYTSGTTGDSSPNQAGSPGWEEENSYVLTAPDGTVYSDGPVPDVGTIVSGTSSCN